MFCLQRVGGVGGVCVVAFWRSRGDPNSLLKGHGFHSPSEKQVMIAEMSGFHLKFLLVNDIILDYLVVWLGSS